MEQWLHARHQSECFVWVTTKPHNNPAKGSHYSHFQMGRWSLTGVKGLAQGHTVRGPGLSWRHLALKFLQYPMRLPSNSQILLNVKSG